MKIIALFIRKIGSIFHLISQKIYPKIYKKSKSKFELELEKWNKVRGDQHLRLDYPMKPESIVIDLGGYEGDWASQIYAMYQSSIYVFEPHPTYFNRIKYKFRNNDKIRAYEFGLASKDMKMRINSDEFSSSAFVNKNDSTLVEIQLNSFTHFMEENNITNINLLKINIEGGEFDLLLHLIKQDWLKHIVNIQIQFHEFVDNAVSMRNDIRETLHKTHELTYDYEFVWESWKRK